MSGRHLALHRSDPGTDLTVATYYAEKTARILRKYGPGPRVHFHSGLSTRPAPRDANAEALRAFMHEGQDRLVQHVTRDLEGSRILDVGCGLGGTAIHCAELGKTVTAITIVRDHVPIIERFAQMAGVGQRVTALRRDAHDLRGLGTFDAVIAVESSCYFDRAHWFHELRRVLSPGSLVHVVDCFAADRATVARFDAYWRTRVGNTASYDAAAKAAGFRRIALDDLGDRTRTFWNASMRWSQLQRIGASLAEDERLKTSIDEHRWLRDAILDGYVTYRHLVFRRS